jgi:hypothetical protein
MPSITKDTGFTVYRIRGGHGDHEWATIALRAWRVDGTKLSGGEPRECGEIMIYSSFGSWAYQWGHCGVPFYRFLVGADMDYVFTKFMGADLTEFDGDGSVKALRQQVIEHRRFNGWSKETARALWDAIEDRSLQLEASERDFVEACHEISSEFDEDGIGRILNRGADADDIRNFLSEPWERTTTRIKPAARGFWRDLWPHLVAQLRTELEAEAVTA